MDASMLKILVVDDDAAMADNLAAMLESLEVREVTVRTVPEEAVAHVEQTPVDLIFVDLLMPGMDGIELLQRIKALRPAPAVVLMTGYPSLDTAVRAMKEGASDFLTKPFRLSHLKIVIEKLARERTLLAENERLFARVQQQEAISALNRRLSDKIREVSALYEISQTLTTLGRDESYDGLYARITEVTATALPARCVVCAAGAPDAAHLRCVAGHNLPSRSAADTIPQAALQQFKTGGDGDAVMIVARSTADHWQSLGIASGELTGCTLAMAAFTPHPSQTGWIVAALEPSADISIEQCRKLLQAVVQRASMCIENKCLNDTLYNNINETLEAMVAVIEARDRYTLAHSRRVTEYALATARHMGCSAEQLAILHSAAQLHDIGKIGISDAILLKNGPLTRAEYQHIQRHPIIGEEILRPLGFLPAQRSIIRSHHERWDGNGYPDGLRGEEIPLLARILTVADSYDAMTTDRPYRAARTPAAAQEELLRCTDQFDPQVLDAFIACVRNGLVCQNPDTASAPAFVLQIA